LNERLRVLRGERAHVAAQQRLDRARELLRHGGRYVRRHERSQILDDDAQIVGPIRRHLGRAPLEEMQSLARRAPVRAKRQFAHHLGDVRHVREVAGPGLLDVPLKLLLNGDRRALGHRLEQFPCPPIRWVVAQRRQLHNQRVLVQTVLGVQSCQPKEEVLLPWAKNAREQLREQLERILGAMHLNQQRDSQFQRMPQFLVHRRIVSTLKRRAKIGDRD